MASIDKKYDFGSLKKWRVDEDSKIAFSCGNNSLHRFCDLSLHDNPPREHCVGQLYRDEAYAGPPDDTLGPLYLYLYGIIRYTYTKSGKQQIHDLYHVLIPFKDFHHLLTQDLIPQVTKYAGDEGIDAMTATEDELVAAISKSYNNFLNRLVNGEASATMQLGNIEFVMDYRFIMERQFRYEGLVSEHYPRMTPVFPLLFVQILLGKWETFTDLEGECCNPTMSSTAVSDEEENVTDDGDTAGRTLLHKPSPLEKSPLMTMETLDEIMDEINELKVAKKLDFANAEEADGSRPSSPVTLVPAEEGDTSASLKPPIEGADDAVSTKGDDCEKMEAVVVQEAGEQVDGDGALASAPEEAGEAVISKIDSVNNDVTEPLDKVNTNTTAMNIDEADTTGAAEDIDKGNRKATNPSPGDDGGKKGRGRPPKNSDIIKDKGDQQQLQQRREGLRSRIKTTVAEAVNVPGSALKSAEKTPREQSKPKKDAVPASSKKKQAKASAKTNGKKRAGRRNVDEDSDDEASSDEDDESEASTEPDTIPTFAQVKRTSSLAESVIGKRAAAAVNAADKAQGKSEVSNKQPRATESGAKPQQSASTVVSSLPTLPKPAPATIIKPPAPTTNSDDKQFVTKGELERIVNNSFSQVLDMLMSRGYFAKDTSNTQAGGYQSPIPLPAGPPIPPPFANASGKKPGSGNGKAGAAGAKKKAKIAFGRPAPPGPSCSSLKAGNQKKLHQPQMQPSQVLPFPAPAGQVAPTVYKFQFVMGSNNSLGHLEAATGRHVSSEAYGGGYSQQHHEMDEEGDEDYEEGDETAMEEEN